MRAALRGKLYILEHSGFSLSFFKFKSEKKESRLFQNTYTVSIFVGILIGYLNILRCCSLFFYVQRIERNYQNLEEKLV